VRWPDYVTIREVGPRDGLQNENKFIPSHLKIKLIRALIKTGVGTIEATSFVHPRAIPQLSDAELVLNSLRDIPDNVLLSALVGNVKGMQRALNTNVREVVVVVSASEDHNRANVKMSVGESLQAIREISFLASGGGTVIRGAVATAFGCPYQGKINYDQVSVVVEGMLEAGIKEITLADTAGLGHPRQVYNLIRKLSAKYPEVTWALHFHDTRGLGLANVVMGIQAGVTILESSVGGLGGCPFIPGATGNVPTEDLVFMLHSMGIRTSIDLEGIIRCTYLLEEILGRRLPARVSHLK